MSLQGLFKDSTMRLIPAFEASPKGYADLYQTVLVDTPIGPYFSQYLEQQHERLTNAGQVKSCFPSVCEKVVPPFPPRGWPCPRCWQQSDSIRGLARSLRMPPMKRVTDGRPSLTATWSARGRRQVKCLA